MKQAGTPVNMARYKEMERWKGKTPEDLKKDFMQSAVKLGIKYYENKVADFEMGQLAEEMRQITVQSNKLTKGEPDGADENGTEETDEVARDSDVVQPS